GISQALRLAEANAVDDGRVVQRVADDDVALVEQRLEEAPVRVEARRVEDRIFHAEEPSEPGFEPLVGVLRPADEPHTREAVAVLVERRTRRLDDARMRAQAEVVVRAEVEDGRRRLAHADRRALRAEQPPLTLLESGRAELVERRSEHLRSAFVHSAARIAPPEGPARSAAEHPVRRA